MRIVIILAVCLPWVAWICSGHVTIMMSSNALVIYKFLAIVKIFSNKAILNNAITVQEG